MYLTDLCLQEHVKETSDVVIHLHQDCCILCLFCIAMCIVNNHNLSYWALFNAASTYRGTLKSRLPHFFGISLHNRVLMNSLQEIALHDQVMRKTSNSLKELSFCTAIFDNSQDFFTLKCQRERKSSKSVVFTLRFFVSPLIPIDYDTLPIPTEKATITYIDQAVPSTCGMINYEAKDILDPASYQHGDEISTLEIDLTGRRVDSYYNMC